MTTGDIVERLSQHQAIAGAPRAELAWLATRGDLVPLAVGDILTSKGGVVRGLFIVLSGHLSISIDRGSGLHRVMEWRGGDVTGLLPYSRLVVTPGDVIAEEPTEILEIARTELPAIIQECPVLTGILVHIMLDRARVFTSNDLHDEKMASLGKLAAGLAHELNNPASAVVRSAEGLARRLLDVESASRAFGAATLDDNQQAAIALAKSLCLSTGGGNFGRSAVARADREDRIATWLESHDAETSAAAALVDSAITEQALDNLARSFSGERLRLALDWLQAECAAHQLIHEIQTAASRIYKLVAAVKGFTYMDQATVQTPVDIGQGLTDTLVVLNSKARTKSVALSLSVEPGLPPVQALGGALNQVWANLVDNALDAAKGEVSVTASRRGQSVVVRVIDDGPGIPAEVQTRIFDPFFTTKAPGAGTGLGLDTARRLVMQHRGDITVDSRPGRTEFTVTLPV